MKYDVNTYGEPLIPAYVRVAHNSSGETSFAFSSATKTPDGDKPSRLCLVNCEVDHRKYDVVALGELLIDFTENGHSPQGNPMFEANAGGAPANVLAMLAKLSRRTAFIGKVGQDMFGNMLVDTLENCDIDAKGVVFDDTANTTLAFVRNKHDGEREFSFFRNPGADTQLAQTDIDAQILESCRIFHFGTLSLTHSPAREATQYAVQTAKNSGALISFDPNLREKLWANLAEAKKQMLWGCSVCDVLKIADEELVFLSEENELAGGVRWLRGQFPNIKLVFVTKGKEGAEGFWGECIVTQTAFTGVKTVDTTGAGDTFCGCCLAHILDVDLDRPDKDALARMMKFACAAAALVTTKKGALCSMPTKKEVLQLF